MRLLRLDSILEPVSVASPGLSALKAAVALAKAAGGTLHVLEMGPPSDASDLRRLVRGLGLETTGVALYPGGAWSAEVVLKAATARKADTIVLGPQPMEQGRDAHAFRELAMDIAARATAPCLLIDDELRLPIGRFLVPIDTSTPERSALAVAL